MPDKTEVIKRINADPMKRNEILKDLDDLLKKHGIEDTDGFFGAPDDTVIKDDGESTVIITIVM